MWLLKIWRRGSAGGTVFTSFAATDTAGAEAQISWFMDTLISNHIWTDGKTFGDNIWHMILHPLSLNKLLKLNTVQLPCLSLILRPLVQATIALSCVQTAGSAQLCIYKCSSDKENLNDPSIQIIS